MQITNLLKSDENRAVSPVIGVILMVAITVILAAVIGTFVLGLGDQVQETSPNTQWSWDTVGQDDIQLTHDGGDTVNAEQLSLRGSEAFNGDGVDDLRDGETLTNGFPDRVSAGDSLTLVEDPDQEADHELDPQAENAEIRLVWTSDGGGQSSTLSRYDFTGSGDVTN